jgi:drug/metabolite transporter (DMT)-like permease
MGTLVLLYGGARVLGERVGPREWLAAAAVIAGVALIAVGHPKLETEVAITPALLACIGGLGVIAASPLLRRGELGLTWLVIAAGSAFALSAITSKLVVAMLDSADIAGAVAFGAATAAAAGLGFLLDMSALQRFDATRAAPPMFVLETAIPVLLAPWLFGEHWGAPVGVGLVLVLGGGAMLGASRAVAGLEDEAGRRAA